MTYLINSIKVIETLDKTMKTEVFQQQINNIAKKIKEINLEKKITLIFGNGGSAADSQHFAAELVCTYKNRNRKPYKAIALTTDTSILTAWSNDFEFDTIFSRQIKAFEGIAGLSIGLSTSGKSKNVINALELSKSMGITTCLICGENQISHNKFDFILKIPSKDTGTVQTVTQVIYHSICDLLENQ